MVQALALNLQRGNTEGADVLAVFVMIAAVVTTIFWMVVGWRAMIAHEKIAAAAQTALATTGIHEEKETASAKDEEGTA